MIDIVSWEGIRYLIDAHKLRDKLLFSDFLAVNELLKENIEIAKIVLVIISTALALLASLNLIVVHVIEE